MAINNALNTGPLSNGQLIIGSTNSLPVVSTLTAGSNISITNGAGSITIAATASGSLVNIQYLTASLGTYTPTVGAVKALVIAVGGGGGGGPSSIVPGSQTAISVGCGGGGGAAGMKFYSNVSAISGSSYTVGAGGAATVTGGSTTFNSGDMYLLGGRGGGYSASASNSTSTINYIGGVCPGGLADATDNSDIVSNGGFGCSEVPAAYSSGIDGYIAFGLGGNSGFCIGQGAYISGSGYGAQTVTGVTPAGYGGGGSGGLSYNNGGSSSVAAVSGGAGAPGVIIVYEYT